MTPKGLSLARSERNTKAISAWSGSPALAFSFQVSPQWRMRLFLRLLTAGLCSEWRSRKLLPMIP